MKFFSNSCTKRNTAFAMLFVWLFALASGVANACLLEAPLTHSHVVTPVTDHDDDHVHDHDSHASKAPCLKACDDGSHSLFKQNSGVDQIDPGSAPLITVLWTAAARLVPAPHRMDDLQPPSPGQPFRVRYSRLTL